MKTKNLILKIETNISNKKLKEIFPEGEKATISSPCEGKMYFTIKQVQIK